jgi:outer membrane autotransporter protein
LTSGLSGGIRRLAAVCLGLWIVLCIGSASPARADCIQTGATVTCSGPSATGFDAGAQDGLGVTVQPGAAVSNAGAIVITLNNNNVVSNLGAISVDPNFSGISGGTGNQVTSAGSITGGDSSSGIAILGGSVMNAGTITMGASGAAGMVAPTVTNISTGTISVGDGSSGILGIANGGILTNNGSIVASGTGSGINLNANVSSVSIFNTGSISVGDDGIGINGSTSNNNNLNIVNSGSITFGGCGTGISAMGTGNTILNSGALTVAVCGGGGGGLGIEAGDSNTVTNTGNIAVSDFGGGISGGSSSILRNSGTIRTGDDGIGIFVNGDNTTASNSGTIIIGDTSSFAGGIVGTGNNLQFSNSGTIVVGRFAFAMGVLSGDNAVMTNSGTLTVGRDGYGMVGQGNGNSFTNSGTITLGRDAFGMFNVGDNGTLLNTGTITGGRGATGMGNDTGSNPTMTNTGTIVLGDGGTGMGHNGDGGVMTNRGTIIAGEFGAGMVTQGSGVTLINSGTISVGADGVGMGSQGIGGVVSNSGLISVGACGVGIDTSPGLNSTVTNTGRIIGTGCSATGVNLGDGDTLNNSGVISAPNSIGSIGAATVMNTGTLDGTIGLSSGSALTNAGLITVSTPLVAGSGAQHFIDGTFTQMRSGTLALRVLPDGSTGNYDTLQVTGVANLGGTLKPIAQSGLYGPTTTYVGALTFASSTGRFDSVAPASLFLAASAVYNPDSVDLVLTRLPFNSVFGGGSANTRAIGNVLEANYSTSLTGSLATFYSNLLQSTSPNTLAQLTGEVATAPQNASFGVFGQFLGTVFGQTATSRAAGQAPAGGTSASMALRSNTTGGGTRTAFALAADCAGSDFCDTTARRVTAWAQGFGGVGSVDGNATTGASRVNLNAAGGALGVDMQVTPNLLAGVTMGTTNAGFGLTDIASSGSSRSIVLGLYGGYTQGPLYVDAAFAYAYNTFNTTRSINTGSMSEITYGAFDGHQYGGRVEGGWRFAIDRHALTPFAGLTVQALSQSGYTETSRDTTTGNPGILGVTVAGQTTTSVRSMLGIQFETTIGAGDSAVVKPRVRLGWAHEFNTNRGATVALNVLPSAPFQVNGATPNADSLVVGAGLELELGRVVRIYGQFDGDFSSNARGLSGTGGIRLVW